MYAEGLSRTHLHGGMENHRISFYEPVSFSDIYNERDLRVLGKHSEQMV